MADETEELNDLRKEYEKLSKAAAETQGSLSRYNSSVRGSIAAASAYIAATKAHIAVKTTELSLAKKLLETRKLEQADVKKRLDETKQTIVQLQQERATAKQLLAAKEATKKSLAESTALMVQESAQRKKNIDSLRETAAANYEEVRYTRSQIDAVSKTKAASEEAIKNLRQKEIAQKSEITSINEKIRAIREGASSTGQLTKHERNSIAALLQRKEGLLQAFNETKNSRKAEIQTRDSLAKRQSELTADLNVLNETGKSLANTMISEQTERQKLSDGVKDNESLMNQLNSDTDELTKNIEDYTDRIASLIPKAGQQDQAHQRATKALNDQADAVDELNGEINTLNSELKRANKFAIMQFQSTLNEVVNPIKKFVEGVRNIQQTFGVVASQALSIGFNDLANSIDSTISALLPLGKSGPPVSMKEIMGAREAFQEEFGGLLTSDAARELAQQSVSMGVTTKQLAQARRVFMTQTMGNANEAKRVQDRFVSEFAKKGLTAKDAMATIAQYSELLARNGTRFATAFTRAAADAKKIGIDLNKISQVGDNIINDFEGFLESQAELGAMGFGFDTSRIAELAATGDDAALYRELRSQLAGMGKDITRLNRPERLALESAFGLNLSEMQRMASGAGSGEKTIEQINLDGNDLLSSAVNFLSGIAAGAVTTNLLLSGILMYQRLAALKAGIPAGMGMLGKMGAMSAVGSGLGAMGLMALPAMGLSPGVGALAGGAMSLVTLLPLLNMIPHPVAKGLAMALSVGAGAYYGYKSSPGMSRGGLIEGPGTDTSDSILTRLSNGEYVMRAAAVRAIGVDTLDKMNKVPGMALGGLIGTVASRSGLLSGLMSKYAKFGAPATEGATGMLANLRAMKDKYTSSEGLMGLASKIPGLGGLTGLMSGGLGGLKGSLMEKGTEFLSKKVPGLSGAMSAISAFKEGGFKGALGSLAKGGIGKAIGGAIGTAIPIPGVGTMLGSVVGSKLGKLAGGLFGKKSPSEMLSAVAQTVVPKIPGMERFTPALEAMGIGGGGGAPSTATPPLVAQQGGAAGGRSNEDAIGRAVAAAVAAALNGVQIKMDGSSVGKVLVNATDAAASLGVFRQTSRATI